MRVFRSAILIVACCLPACSQSRRSPPAVRPNVLLVTIDTFRADRMTPELTPTIASLVNGAGVLLVEAKRAAEAAALFEQAVEASPDFVEGRLNLGIALQESGDAGRAAAAYRQVLAAPGSHAREKDAAARLLAGLQSQP